MRRVINSAGRIAFPFFLSFVVIAIGCNWAAVMGFLPAGSTSEATTHRVLGILGLVFSGVALQSLGSAITVDFDEEG